MLKYKVHGKWILAGEHSVLRGCPALVFPVRSRALEMAYYPSARSLEVRLQESSQDMEMAFWGVLEKALQQVGRTRADLSGEIVMSSNVPIGAGMGASATLCVALAHWFVDLGFLGSENQFVFAKELENLFHGQSSGVDVAVALQNRPLLFTRPHEILPFAPNWQPCFYLSYSGRRGITSDCIRKVRRFMERNPGEAAQVDEQMKQAVSLARDSLMREGALMELVSAVKLAASCFRKWGLVNQELERHMESVQQAGALATKPTGSGDGGFVLSLWQSPPDSQKLESLGLIEA